MLFHSLPQKVMSFVAGKSTVINCLQFSMMTGTRGVKKVSFTTTFFQK